MTKQRTKLTILLISILLAAITLLTSCNSGEKVQGASDKPVVYTSFYPIYDLVQSVAGEKLDVRVFMSPDKDPHLWEPTPKDIRELVDADFLIVNGANMEQWLPNVRQALPELEVLNLSDSVELIKYTGAAAIGDFRVMAKFSAPDRCNIEFGHTHEDIMRVAFYRNDGDKSEEELIEIGKEAMEEQAPVVRQHSELEVESGQVYALEMGHESGIIHLSFPEEGEWIFYSDRISDPVLPYLLTDLEHDELETEMLRNQSTSGLDQVTYDPHSWLSLKNTKKYLQTIFEELSARYPEYERVFKRNKVKIVDQLTKLEYEYRGKFKELDKRDFVVTHHAYAYLARDFELRQFALQGLISTDSPSLKTIRKALDICNHYDLDTVFYEYGREQKGADTLALELGGKTLPLASMEYITPEQRKNPTSYQDLMRMNLENLYLSLGGTQDE